ncbi:MAG: 2-hydroxyacid dehydrogenase [Candidatus Competibacterales bacterium]
MRVALLNQLPYAPRWRRALAQHCPEAQLVVWPDIDDPATVDVVLTWRPPPKAWELFTGIKLIACMGAGVDNLLFDPQRPSVPVVRLVDPTLSDQMVEYVCHEVLHHHRNMADYARLQGEGRWERLPQVPTAERTVGMLGLGAIGGACATRLAQFGFPVVGWSRTPKTLPGVNTHHGAGGFDVVLAKSQILICLLPLTPATQGIINADTLAKLPMGAYLINVGRGGHVKDGDLLAALDGGGIAGATLDVFTEEPLPSEHPYWRHPKVRLTPHIASEPQPEFATPQIADNLRRFINKQPLMNLVDFGQGY